MDVRLKLKTLSGDVKTNEDEFVALATLFYRKDKTKIGRLASNVLRKDYPEAFNRFEEVKKIDYNKKTCMSGVNLGGDIIRKGSVDAIQNFFLSLGHAFPDECIREDKRREEYQDKKIDVISRNGRVVGFIELTLIH